MSCTCAGKSEVTRWTPSGFDVRTRVHEYGGGTFTVHNNTVFFSHAIDDAIYKQEGPGSVTNPKNVALCTKGISLYCLTSSGASLYSTIYFNLTNVHQLLSK